MAGLREHLRAQAIGAQESQLASVPVPESDELREGIAAVLGVDADSDLLEELRSRTESDAEVIGDLNATVLRLRESTPSPVPEEPEGEKALRFLRELRAHLNDGLRTIEDLEERGKLDDYWLGRQQELEAVSVWLKAVEEGLRCEVEEPEQKPIHNSAPEIKVGQMRQGYGERLWRAVAVADDPLTGPSSRVVAHDPTGTEEQRFTLEVWEGFPLAPEGLVELDAEINHRERVDWTRPEPPPAPSLNPEGLAKLDAKIYALSQSDLARYDVMLSTLKQAREWLVGEEAENDE